MSDPLKSKVHDLQRKTLAEQVSELKSAFRMDPQGAYHIGIRLGLRWPDALDVINSTIEHYDASTIRWWLDFYATVAGPRRLTVLLETWLSQNHDERVSKSIYWLGWLKAAQTDQASDFLRSWLSEHPEVQRLLPPPRGPDDRT